MRDLLSNITAQYTGVLDRNAEVRSKLLDESGVTIPVVCIDMVIDSAAHPGMHAEFCYGLGQQQLAEADAKALKKGMRVTVQAPIVGMRVVAPNATLIQRHEDQP